MSLPKPKLMTSTEENNKYWFINLLDVINIEQYSSMILIVLHIYVPLLESVGVLGTESPSVTWKYTPSISVNWPSSFLACCTVGRLCWGGAWTPEVFRWRNDSTPLLVLPAIKLKLIRVTYQYACYNSNKTFQSLVDLHSAPPVLHNSRKIYPSKNVGHLVFHFHSLDVYMISNGFKIKTVWYIHTLCWMSSPQEKSHKNTFSNPPKSPLLVSCPILLESSFPSTPFDPSPPVAIFLLSVGLASLEPGALPLGGVISWVDEWNWGRCWHSYSWALYCWELSIVLNAKGSVTHMMHNFMRNFTTHF